MVKQDFHNAKRNLASQITNIENDKKLSKRNKKFIFDFKDFCYTENLSDLRVYKYMFTLPRLAKILKKDFDKAKRVDIERVVRQINQKDWKEWTKVSNKAILKKFYKWLRSAKGYPYEVQFIKTNIKKSCTKLPDDLLTREEITKLIKQAQHPRDKAFISLLYESGARIGEILSLQIKNIKFDDDGFCTISVTGKTGDRRIPIIESIKYVKQWIETHPLCEDHEAPLWVRIIQNKAQDDNKNIYRGMCKVIKRLAERAKITKRVHPHLFRHSRLTELAKAGWNEAKISKFAGHVMGSEMPRVYIHISNQDIIEDIREFYGIKTQKQNPGHIAKKCPQCAVSVQKDSLFCHRCRIPLTHETANEIMEQKAQIDKALKGLDIKSLEDLQSQINKINKALFKMRDGRPM